MRPYCLPLVALLRHACVHIIINSRIFINRNDQFIHYTDRKIMAIALGYNIIVGKIYGNSLDDSDTANGRSASTEKDFLISETKENIYKQKRCDAWAPNEIFSN